MMNGEETVLKLESNDTDIYGDQSDDSGPVITESISNSYFSHCNVLSKSIISEQRSLVKYLGDKWNEFDCDRGDALLNLIFVEDDVRQQFTTLKTRDEDVIQESFPRLYLNSGQKINLDFENDVWTWRDEHSGPFSWMSRSQQDLTLCDLETENISKPQPKTLRVDTENPENLKEAEQHFNNPADCWSRDVIDGYRKAEKSISLSPCVSIEFEPQSKQQSGEEVNEAFEDINEVAPIPAVDSPVNEIYPDDGQLESQDISSDATQIRKNSGKEKRKRSPSPKKILRSSSLRRSPSKCSDQGEQQLISKQNDESYEEEHNSFSNPLVETHWSSFVGDNNGKTEHAQDDIPMKSVHSYMPTSQVMNRGVELSSSSSPYQVQKDNVNLIAQSNSPAVSQRGPNPYTVTNQLEGWSAESTPDHNTHLLKGMENDKVKRPEPSSLNMLPKALEKFENEEILTVESQGSDIKITTDTKSENKRDSDIPATGFDFLDNW